MCHCRRCRPRRHLENAQKIAWLALLVVACTSGHQLTHAEAAVQQLLPGKGESSYPLINTPIDATSPAPRPRVLLWVPIHISEPTANLEAMVACTFKRHAPSLVGEAFDVLVTLAGNASDGREADLASLVWQATAGITPVPTTVRTEFLFVAKDDYDRDQSKDESSSYAGPNIVFYTAMLEEDEIGKGDGNGGGASGSLGDTSNPDTGISLSLPAPPPSNSPSFYRRQVGPYAFVQIMETDCCAVQAGWLDALLEPMLRNPKLLISGSRPKAACFSPVEHGGGHCKMPNYVRLHINGNAMYRVGPEMQTLLRDAKLWSKDEAPFDLAMYFVRTVDQSHAHDNPRMYSVAGLVDDALWTRPGFYGGQGDVAFVHAPRRMRTDGVRAVVSRTKKRHPTVAVMVAPSVTTGTSSAPGLAVDTALLRNCHASLGAAAADHSLVYIALTWPAFVEASRIAPFRVLLANGTRADDVDGWPDPGDLAVRALTAAAALARADLSLLVLGTDAAIVRPDFHLDLLAMSTTAGKHDELHTILRLLEAPGGSGPLVPVSSAHTTSAQSVLDVGMMLVSAGQSAADFVECWAAGLNSTTPGRPPAGATDWYRAADIVAALPSCTLEKPSSVPWRTNVNFAIDWLPAEAYATGTSYMGPFWTNNARKRASFVVAAGITPPGHHFITPPEFRLRQAGLWLGGPALGCANYSALARSPVLLGQDLGGVHRALARHARFLRGVADHGIACAVLPGFRVATTGNVVPFDAVLRADTVADLARKGGGRKEESSHLLLRPHVRFYPTAASLNVPYQAFVDLNGGRPLTKVDPARRRCQHQQSRAERLVGARAGLAGTSPTGSPAGLSAHPPASLHACTTFGLPGTTCFAPDVAEAILTAARALPSHFWCVTDLGRSPAEAAVLALEGRLHLVDGLARRLVGAGSSPQANATILLTGAPWRATAAARSAGDHGVAVITLADLPGAGDATPVDPITRLVRPDTAAQSSAAASPWADIIEYAICQAGLGVRAMPGEGVPSLLAATSHAGPAPLRPSTLLPRLVARIPPAVLQENLEAFTTWLARPDRPGLGGRWVRTRWRRGDKPAPGSSADRNASPHVPPPTPAQGARLIITTAHQVRALDASLGFVPGLPPRPDPDCTGGLCTRTSWSPPFGPANLRQMQSSTHGQLLPPALAVLIQPGAAVEIFEGGGLPIVAGGMPGDRDFQASQDLMSRPHLARAVVVLRRVLDARAGSSAAPGSRLQSPTMWMASGQPAWRLARLKHFVGEASTVVVDVGR
jgi:hypothetical protein